MVCLLPKRNLRVSDLNRDEIESAIAELADQLSTRNVKAKVYLGAWVRIGQRVLADA